MADLTDVTEAYQEYYEWIGSGRNNEDEGGVLREELKNVMTAYFFANGSFEETLEFANKNSGHGWMKGRGKVGVTVEADNKPEEVWAP